MLKTHTPPGPFGAHQSAPKDVVGATPDRQLRRPGRGGKKGRRMARSMKAARG